MQVHVPRSMRPLTTESKKTSYLAMILMQPGICPQKNENYVAFLLVVILLLLCLLQE